MNERVAVPITGELQKKAFIIICPGNQFLWELYRTPEAIRAKQRAVPMLSPLRSAAKLFTDAHIAKAFRDFVSVEYPQAEIQEVSDTDPQLGSSFHRARQMPNVDSQRRRAENMQARVVNRLSILLAVMFCLATGVFAQGPAGAGSEHHRTAVHRPHIHKPHVPHVRHPHVHHFHRPHRTRHA